MIRIKNREFNKSKFAMVKLFTFTGWPIPLWFAVKKFQKKFEDSRIIYIVAKREIHQRWIEKDEKGKDKIDADGNFIYTDENAADKDFDELADQESEIDADKIRIDMAQLKKETQEKLMAFFSSNDGLLLEPFVEFIEPAEAGKEVTGDG